MINKLIIILSILLISFTTAMASPSYTGIHMFNESGNNQNITEVERLINNWFDVNNIFYKSDLKYYQKLEDDGTTEDDSYKSYFEFENNETSGSSGTWKTKDPVIFYSLKAGNEYAMYWLEVPKQEGSFSTENYLTNNHGKALDLSHITFYTNNNVYNETPEPTTLILFGFGLITIASLSRRKNI